MTDIGLTDKLYWRQQHASSMRFHCFERADGGGPKGRTRYYVALCSDTITLARSGGQAIRRPPAYARCASCDNAEAKRRGWTESGPESGDWQEYL